ncbi:MAG: hypothetical protein OXC80_11005 [Gammaproteobacteria bacterium]|nr:hypothetical protein [Gammaproteobacteria bacterium]
MNDFNWEGTPTVLKRFWWAMVKFGSPKLTKSAIQSRMTRNQAVDVNLELDESARSEA